MSGAYERVHRDPIVADWKGDGLARSRSAHDRRRRAAARISLTARVGFAVCAAVTVFAAFLPWNLPILHRIPWREAEHFAAFFVLTCGAALSFPSVRLSALVVASGLVGVGMELVQGLSWVGRHGAVSDGIADALGAAAVLAVATLTTLRQAQAMSAPPPATRREDASRRVRLSRLDRWPGR